MIDTAMRVLDLVRQVYEQVKKVEENKAAWEELRWSIQTRAKEVIEPLQQESVRKRLSSDEQRIERILKDMENLLQEVLSSLGAKLDKAPIFESMGTSETQSVDGEVKSNSFLRFFCCFSSRSRPLALAAHVVERAKPFAFAQQYEAAIRDAKQKIEERFQLLSEILVSRQIILAVQQIDVTERQEAKIDEQAAHIHIIKAGVEYLQQQASSSAKGPFRPVSDSELRIFPDVVYSNETGDWRRGRLLKNGHWRPVLIKKGADPHRDMEIMSQFNSTKIVSFEGGFVQKDETYLVTSPVKFLKQELSALSFEKRLKIAADLVEGLQAIHRRHLLHANIRPDVVGIADEDQGQWFDLSFAKSTADFQSMDTLSPDKLSEIDVWHAPETWGQRHDVTVASDVYSMGWLLWWIYTGKTPLEGKSLDEIKKHIESGDRETLVSGPYGAIIQEAWSADPKKRPNLEKMLQAVRATMKNPLHVDESSGESEFLSAVAMECAEKERAKEAGESPDYTNAEKFYKISEDKGYYKALTRAGTRAMVKGRYLEAKKYFEETLEKFDYALAHCNLGILYHRHGKEIGCDDWSMQARACYRKALVSPDDRIVAQACKGIEILERQMSIEAGLRR